LWPYLLFKSFAINCSSSLKSIGLVT
jgi:hypothetical protein